jgi:hypothetical protein
MPNGRINPAKMSCLRPRLLDYAILARRVEGRHDVRASVLMEQG